MVDLKALSAICDQCIERASNIPLSLWFMLLLSTFTGAILFVGFMPTDYISSMPLN